MYVTLPAVDDADTMSSDSPSVHVVDNTDHVGDAFAVPQPGVCSLCSFQHESPFPYLCLICGRKLVLEHQETAPSGLDLASTAEHAPLLTCNVCLYDNPSPFPEQCISCGSQFGVTEEMQQYMPPDEERGPLAFLMGDDS